MGDIRDNPPLPKTVDVTITFGASPMIRSVTEVSGIHVVATDGRELSGQPLRGFAAVASHLERHLRYSDEPIRGEVEQKDGWLELTAIWVDDKLIDGDGADISPRYDDDDDESLTYDPADYAALLATDYFGRIRVQPMTALATAWIKEQAFSGVEWDGDCLIVDVGGIAEGAAAAKRDGRTFYHKPSAAE
jgi:hypothetical protein